MNVMILSDNEAFSKLSSDVIAKQHFIAYGDGPTHYRIIKSRQTSVPFGAKITTDTLHWYISQYEKD